MIVPAVGSVNYGVGSVPLPAYLWHHQWLDECSFWGVQTPGKKVSCLWTQHQRNQLDHYLCVALQKLRECLPYALMPEYTVDERVTPLDSSMRCTIKLASRYIHELGVEAWDSIFKNAVVVLRSTKSMKSQGFVQPGDQLVVKAEIKSREDSLTNLKVSGFVNDERAVSGLSLIHI